MSTRTWSDFLTPVRESSPGVYVGLGIGIEDGPAGRTFFHSGNNGRRFTSYMAGNLATGLGLVYLASAYDGITLAEALAAPVLGDEQPAQHRAGWDRYDDPRRLASKSVQRAAVERGGDAAREQFRAIRANPATRLSLDGTLELGRILVGRGLIPLAIEVLETAVADAPDSARSHLVLGRALESAGDLQSAIGSYRRSLTLEPHNADALRQLQWAEQRLAARARRVAVPLRTLESYTGQYQERQITLRGGRLYYKRGANPETPLVAMAEDLFELEADPMFRVWFVGDGVRPATKLVGMYNDGSTDESVRSR